MWNFFLVYNRFTLLLILTLVGVGVYSAIAIPKESAPEVQVPVGVVTTILPGAPATDIETLVTNEIERGLSGQLENVKKITSTSREGISQVTVEFLAEADIDTSIADLKDAIDTIQADLPADAEDPVVTEVDFVNQPILTLTVSGEFVQRELVTLAKIVESELESIEGVSKVDVSGIPEEEVTIFVDPAKLARFNLNITDVTRAIRSANTVFPIGQIESQNVMYNLTLEGDIPGTDVIGSTPIAGLGGEPIYIRDIASVSDGLSTPETTSRVSVAGSPAMTAVTFNIYKQRGGDIVRLTERIRSEVERLSQQSEVLHTATSYIAYDAGRDIKRDLSNLISSGVQTIILVIIILVAAIGWREGLLAGLSIPLTFTIGFIGLYFSGNTINFISLFALILGIGVLVDSGIVMVEAMHREIDMHPKESRIVIARRVIAAYASPLISGTLTTVAMFIGLFIVSGVTGQFIAGIPFTLIFILLASILVALAFLPLLSTFVLQPTSRSVLQKSSLDRVTSWYERLLYAILGNKKRERFFLVAISLSFIGSLLLIPLGVVKVVFFEQTDAPQVYVEIELPEGTTKEQTDIAVRQIEDVLYLYTDSIEAFTTTIGAGSVFGAGGQNEKLANITINLREDRTQTSTEFVTQLREVLPNLPYTTITVSEPNNGPPAGSPIGITLLGDDLSALAEGATHVENLLRSLPHTTNIESSNRANTTEYSFQLDRAKAAAYNLSPLTISESLRASVFGTEATTITTLTDDIGVRVRLNLTGEANPQLEDIEEVPLATIENLTFPVANGSIPLRALVETRIQESNSTIVHENQERTLTVSSDLTEDGNVFETNAQIRTLLAETTELPTGVSFRIGGEADESNQAFIELFLALVVGIVLMIAVLVFEFNSFRYTFYVLSIIPFSLIGILGGLAITGTALSFPSIMGFIALTGIIVNNSILLIDKMNEERRKDPNVELKNLIVRASSSRLRPIILTSATTVAGMVPLLSSDPIWVPLAAAVIFGLLFSVVITLFLVPVIYHRWPGSLSENQN